MSEHLFKDDDPEASSEVVKKGKLQKTQINETIKM